MAGTEIKGSETKDTKVKPDDHASDQAKEAAAKQIATMPASAQRDAVKKEMDRVAATSGASLPELTIGKDRDSQIAVISKDGKPVEVVDQAGKTWKADGKNLFSDGNEQRLLAPKMIDGKPAQNADGSPQLELMQVQTRQVDNGDGTKHSVITQITDGDGRKWASADGQNFVGAAGSNGGQAGDQRVLKDNNGSLEFSDPKGGPLSEQAVKGKEQEIQNLIQQSTYAVPSSFGDPMFSFAPPAEGVDGSKLNKVLENSPPELLARIDKDMNLRATMKDKMSGKDYEDLTRILDGATNINAARADRIFANGTGNSGADSHESEQEAQRLMLQTNAADMPKLNDALLSRINSDPNEKKAYDQYVEQHKNDPGFDAKNAALLAFSANHFSKETQDAMGLLTKGNDQLDTTIGGTTARQQLIKQALDNKDFDLFKTAVTDAPPEARAAISKDAVDKAFSQIDYSAAQYNMFGSMSDSDLRTTQSQRNIDIAHDLIDKGEVQPSTLIKYSNMDQAEKILANLTPEQRNSYNAGKDSTDPNNDDRQFYNSMQASFQTAAGGDAVKALKLDDEARKQDGSFVGQMAKHEGTFFNDSNYQIKQDFGNLTAEQRQDLTDNYAERRKQMSDMLTALNRDPKEVLDKFDEYFKKAPNAQPDADGAAVTLLDKVRTEQSKANVVIGDMDGSMGAAQKAENVAMALHHAFQDDPGLFGRLKNPQTESEKQLAAMLKDQDQLFGASKDQYGKVATEGRLPLDQALIVDRDDPKQAAKDILGASPEDQKRFLTDTDAAKLWLGSKASVDNVDQKYDILKNALTQGKMQPEDEARAVAIGWKQPDDLKGLTGLSSEMGADYQKKYGEDLQLSLLNKYGHQDNSVNDFLSKYNNVFQNSDNASHNSAVAASGWASAILDGNGSMSPEQMKLAATQMSDLSAKLQKQLDTAPDGAKPEIQAFMESQKRLKDAIDNHQDATKQLAETVDKAVNVAVTMAVIAGTAGGASVPMIMAGIAAGGISRYEIKDELLGPNWKDKDKAKETFDLAVDTAAQMGAMKLMKVATLLKAAKPGEALSSSALAELEANGVSREVALKASNAIESQGKQLTTAAQEASPPANPVHELPAPKTAPPATPVHELPAPQTAPPANPVHELPAPQTAHPVNSAPQLTAPEVTPPKTIPVSQTTDEIAKQALPKPTGATGTEVQPAVTPDKVAPKPTGTEVQAAPKVTPGAQDLAKMTPGELPAQAPLKLQGPSPNDVLSGKATPEQLAKLPDSTKEFLFQMAQLGGIGAIDAKLKGQNAAEGAAEWMAMGAAAHGVFAGLAKSGIKVDFPENSLRTGEIGGRTGELNGAASEIHDAPTLTTGDGTKITRVGDNNFVNGKPADVKYTKDGDTYTVEYHLKDNPKDEWIRFDSQNKNGTTFQRTEFGEVHYKGSEANFDRVDLTKGDRFEKNADGKWHEMKQNASGQWTAVVDDSRGAIQSVQPRLDPATGKQSFDVTYENSVRTYRDNTWTEQSTKPAEKPAAPQSVETVRPAAPQEAVPPVRPETVPPVAIEPAPQLKPPAPEIIEPVRPPSSTLPTIADAEPTAPVPAALERPATITPNPLPVVPEPRPIFEPGRIVPTNDGLPTVIEPTLPRTADNVLPVAPEAPVPARIEPAQPAEAAVPAVREPAVTPAPRAANDNGVPENTNPALSPDRQAAIAAQTTNLVPHDNTTPPRENVEPPPIAPPEVPPANPANAPLEPSAALAALATVKNWEGPFHSSDRVLQAVLGRRPTFEEVRTLTRAMQEQFKLDHNGQDIKTVGLKHGDQFITAQNVDSLLGQVAKTNPELAGQMRAYMQVDHDLGATLGRPAAPDEVRALTSQLQQNFMAQNQLQSFAQADAQKWRAFEAANATAQSLADLEAKDQRLKQIADYYQANHRLPADGIISQRAFPSSAGHLRHPRRVAHR